MDELMLLPAVVIYGVIGACAGVVGGVVSVVVSRAVGRTLFAGQHGVVVLLFIALFARPQPRIDRLRETAHDRRMLREDRLAGAVIAAHPEVEDQLLAGVMQARDAGKNREALAAALSAASAVVDGYVGQHMLTASDDVVHAVLNRTLSTLIKLKQKPESCVAYYMGTTSFAASDMDADFLAAEREIKAAVIESSVRTPSPPVRISVDALADLLGKSLRENHLPLDTLTRVEAIADLSAQEGCAAATAHTQMLATLPPHEASLAFKNLLIFDETGSSP